MKPEEPVYVTITDEWGTRLRMSEIVVGWLNTSQSFPYADEGERIHQLMNARNLAAKLVREGPCTDVEDEL